MASSSSAACSGAGVGNSQGTNGEIDGEEVEETMPTALDVNFVDDLLYMDGLTGLLPRTRAAAAGAPEEQKIGLGEEAAGHTVFAEWERVFGENGAVHKKRIGTVDVKRVDAKTGKRAAGSGEENGNGATPPRSPAQEPFTWAGFAFRPTLTNGTALKLNLSLLSLQNPRPLGYKSPKKLLFVLKRLLGTQLSPLLLSSALNSRRQVASSVASAIAAAALRIAANERRGRRKFFVGGKRKARRGHSQQNEQQKRNGAASRQNGQHARVARQVQLYIWRRLWRQGVFFSHKFIARAFRRAFSLCEKRRMLGL